MELEFTFLGTPAQCARLARHLSGRLLKEEKLGPPLSGAFYIEHWERKKLDEDIDHIVIRLACLVDHQYDYLGRVEVERLPGGKSQLVVIAGDDDWPKVEPIWNRLQAMMERRGWLGQTLPEWPDKPSKDAPREAWFEYKNRCDQAGIKFTHQQLAEALNLSPGYARNIYADWKAGGGG